MNKKVYLVLLSTLILALFFSGEGIYSQEKAIKEKQVRDFAQTSLEGYIKNVLTKENIGKFGFGSLDETKTARVGGPLPVRIIELKELKAYKSGASVNTLPADVDSTWFPVLAGNEVRAELRILRIGGKLTSGDFGRTIEAQRLAAVREKMPEILQSKQISEPNAVTILEVPELKAILLFVEAAQGEFLIPAMALPQRYELNNGEVYPADKVLSRLREFAEKIPEGLIR